MDTDESSNPSLNHSDVMIVTEESPESSKKRKLRAEESDFLPLPKHFCLKQQEASLSDSSCQSSSVTEFAECSYTMEDTKTRDETSSSASVTWASSSKDPTYSTVCSSSGYAVSSIDQCCSKGNDYKTQEYVEDHMEFICPEFAVEDLKELLNPVGSYTLSSSRWSLSSQDSEEEATTMQPTIDKEFEEYFSTLMM